jgi:ABC-type multidrug transport system permease subunit
MKIYTSLKSIPELADLTPQERTIAWYSCQGKTNAHWQTWVGSIIAAIISVTVGVGLTYLILLFAHPVIGVYPAFLLGGFIAGVIIVSVFQFLRRVVVFGQIGPYLQEYLDEKKSEGDQRISIPFIERQGQG